MTSNVRLLTFKNV